MPLRGLRHEDRPAPFTRAHREPAPHGEPGGLEILEILSCHAGRQHDRRAADQALVDASSFPDALSVLTAPLIGFPLLVRPAMGHRAETTLPKVRNWMNTNSWVVREIVIVFFLVLALKDALTSCQSTVDAARAGLVGMLREADADLAPLREPAPARKPRS